MVKCMLSSDKTINVNNWVVSVVNVSGKAILVIEGVRLNKQTGSFIEEGFAWSIEVINNEGNIPPYNRVNLSPDLLRNYLQYKCVSWDAGPRKVEEMGAVIKAELKAIAPEVKENLASWFNRILGIGIPNIDVPIPASKPKKAEANTGNRFINWLKRSGINYYSDKTEMIDSLNPLDVVIENPAYPMARIYRESFWTGIVDTYDVLMGNHFDREESGKGRIGILDILIVPLISRRLIAFGFNPENHDNALGVLACIIAGIVGIPLEICRGVAGVGLTLLLSPVVILVHLCSFFKASSLKRRAENLDIAISSILTTIDLVPSTYTKLSSYLSSNKSNIRNIRYRSDLGDTNHYCLIPTPVPPPFDWTPVRMEPRVSHFFQVDKPQRDQEALDAFSELNVGARRVS